jgi:CHRD domain
MRIAICIVALSLTVPAAAAHADTLYFHTVLSGSKEKVPNKVLATGAASVALDTDTKIATYRVEFSGLSGPTKMVHFHGLKLPGMKAPEVIIMRMGPQSSPVTGAKVLTDTQITELKAGQWYANVHTEKYPDGEIRGWLTSGK